MKVGPITKLDKKNKTMSKKLTLTSCRKIVMSFLFFGFLANWSHPEARFRTQSAKVMFSVIAAFCLTKAENRT